MAKRKLLFGDPTWYFLARFCLYPRLLIQLVRRFGKPVLCSSPAPCATWPALFWLGCVASPPPRPTCSVISRARFLVPPFLAQLGQLYLGMICLHLRLIVRPTRKYRSERCLVAYSFVRYWTPQQVNARPTPKYRSKGCLLAYSFVRYWTPQQVNVRPTEI